MKSRNKVALTLAVTILSTTAMPAVYAAAESDNIAPNAYVEAAYSKDEITNKLSELRNAIEKLENIKGELGKDQLNWLKELKKAYEFVNKLAKNSITRLTQAREKLVVRIDLLTNVAETITADATELADSEQQAHVIIGFSVTRALLKGVDVFASPEELSKASEDLQASLEKAREVSKQTDDSRRTHYNIEKLNIALNKAINIRNNELRGKLDPEKLAQVDLVIRNAKDVKRNARATVGEINNMIEELNAVIDEAYNSIDAGDRIADNKIKLELQKDIQDAKNLRDFKLKGNVDSKVIAELNRAIADANRVYNNKKSTVNEVQFAIDRINAAIEEAKSYLEAPEEALPEEDEVVEEDLNENEAVEEIPS
ncbi:CAMP factor family pore-forming toxin [Peptoniphilus sp.]|jgi:hypothetical protein|uniref:CAMP factor family pore-forming toxin n=1 Tax=Peptoniphilus sp. TaxID=1971214 RepID=UPI003D8E164A